MKTRPSKILIIDDDPGVRSIVSKILLKKGYEPTTAATGEEGLDLASRHPPDLVLCDLEMPQMDGYTVLARLRSDAKLAEIPLIFLTGRAESAQVRLGMNLGADDYVTKPFAQEDLLNAVKARLDRHQFERDRAQAKLDRAMRMLATMVHDLRNPLSVIFGYTDLVKDSVGLKAGELPVQMLERMQQATLQMQAILSEILLQAKTQVEDCPREPSQIDLRMLCDSLTADHEQHERLSFQCEPRPFPLVAEALRLRQAIGHLISNALKFSAGPVVVCLTAAPPGYRLEVRDAGIGIPLEERAGIFKPFFRASNTEGRPGHGLGLSLAKSWVELQGGSITFTTALNQGSTFLIELPATVRSDALLAFPSERPTPARATANTLSHEAILTISASPAHAGAEELAADGCTRKMRGIIVDDDPLVRDVLRDMSRQTDELTIVGEAGSVREARVLLKQQHPEVVLLDVNLPDGSGFDLLADVGVKTAVIFVTSTEEYAVHAFDCEAADYLLKPVTTERLQQGLQRVRQRISARVPPESLLLREQGSFVVKTLTDRRFIKFGEIRNISAYGEYSWVYWDSGKGAMLRKPLKQWQLELPKDHFVRVHRGAIVNIDYIDHIEKLAEGRMQIHLRGILEAVPVSVRLAPLLNRKLKALHPR